MINDPSLYLDRDCKFCAGLSFHMIILQSFDLWFAQLLVDSEDFDMKVFKDDEMIAEMTGTEVGACSSFEEAILHQALNSYWICFWSLQIWNWGPQLRLIFEALCSGSQFKCTAYAYLLRVSCNQRKAAGFWPWLTSSPLDVSRTSLLSIDREWRTAWVHLLRPLS